MLSRAQMLTAFHEAGHITIASVMDIPVDRVEIEDGKAVTRLARNLAELELSLALKYQFLAAGAAGETFYCHDPVLEYSSADQSAIALLGGGSIKKYIPGAVKLIGQNRSVFDALVGAMRDALDEASPFDVVLLTADEVQAILHPYA